MHGDDYHHRQHPVGMTDLERFQRACRVFLARLLTVHGEDAPDVLRRMADELAWLEAERAEPREIARTR